MNFTGTFGTFGAGDKSLTSRIWIGLSGVGVHLFLFVLLFSFSVHKVLRMAVWQDQDCSSLRS